VPAASRVVNPLVRRVQWAGGPFLETMPMAAPGRPDHDALYHRVFSHPGVVAQLL
jgi:hypothetical protein